ncbi:hypothetical protein DCAR_0727074 [Daucus carota subsp. sativus]|uniref:Uncharacterized protein n=1 Tax=Daucus carota subsp. sativus TaxID=79200 RepID=A0A161ZKF0_DAUCS|nr:PREDICTED: proline-rich receptor-like protein kinase PERK14 [Daucus carota subsp. sativus]WOH07641.1 hypothetical protein DCAR_0727074 [Daucus carota subsp. sativus]
MSPKPNLHTLLPFLVLINLLNFPTLSSSETECTTYPCSPSPPSESATAGTMSPPQLTGGSVYPPPAPGGSLPTSPLPPGQASSATLPSPDSVVPWYPYYSKRPSHDTDQPSSTSRATRTVLIGSTVVLVFGFLVSSFQTFY